MKTLVKYFGLPVFKHHDTTEDAIACANIFLKLREHGKEESSQSFGDVIVEFKGIVLGILADDEVDYKEAYEILSGLDLKQTVFRCNHASNYLPLEGRLPQDKEILLAQIKAAITGEIKLIPEFLRGL